MAVSISNNGESTVPVSINSTHHVRKFNDPRRHDCPIYSFTDYYGYVICHIVLDDLFNCLSGSHFSFSYIVVSDCVSVVLVVSTLSSYFVNII